MRYVFALVIILWSCTDPFVLEDEIAGQQFIVVNGSITTLEGPQEVRVFHSGDINNPDATSFPIRDARVYVLDDAGNQEEFLLQSDELQDSYCVDLDGDLGSVSTLDLQTNYRYVSREDFTGIPGRTYTLFVELADGRVIESDPQLLKPAKAIKGISYEYLTNEVVNNLGNPAFRDVWEVKVLLEDLVPENYLTWRYRGTYYVETNPELYCDYRPCGPGTCIPQCCSECWVTEYGQNIQNFSPGTSFKTTNEVLAATIPIEDQRTTSIYLLDLYQFHVDQKVFSYFESIDNQLTNQGSIFDPPPYSVASNLRFTDGSGEKILGYFWAGGVAHKTLEISPTSVTRQYNFFYPNDCQTIPGASTEKPDRYPF